MGRTGPWSDADRRDFREAMDRHAHSQKECASALCVLGLPTDQSSVSKWLKDRNPQAKTITVLRRYIDEALGTDRLLEEDHDQIVVVDSLVDSFQQSVSALSNEPLLGPRQGAAIDALVERLRTGPVMADHDETAMRAVFQVLRLD